MPNFHAFATAVARRFDEMKLEKLFVVASDRDEIWQRYLAAFPPGTDPIFRVRTEHDCSCCRGFIRSIGNVVVIQNGALASIWDLNGLPEPYQAVADGMAAYIKGLPVVDIFLTPQAKHGTAVSREYDPANTYSVRTWHHFAVKVPSRLVAPIMHAEERGKARTTFDVLKRGILELHPSAVATVADLIAENAIYRGAEHKAAVSEFQNLQQRVIGTSTSGLVREPPELVDIDIMIWAMIDSPVARFRNTVIGTLVQDLSDGVDLERAVRSFETKVAPQNYKRPTALITKAMVNDAMKTIRDLGIEASLERRHARLSDVSVNSVIFVDNAVRPRMKGGLEGMLLQEIKPAPFDATQAEEIPVDAFMAGVLPRTTGLQLYLDNGLMGNFMSLTAPANADSKSLFRWSNDFAWSYDGNVTDSIKDRVKRAGGQVEGVAMRVSLSWQNTDDLDLHIKEPDGNHIYFGNKGDHKCRSGGYLDVDMNIGGETREPVENIRWIRPPRNGTYRVWVNNFTKRESIDVGFTVEIETPHGLETFRFEKAVPNGRNQIVAHIEVTPSGITTKAEPGIIAGASSREKWGLKTLDMVKVNSVVLSPNHWDEPGHGNRHWFFIVDGCKNPEPCRGIYNEFLSSKLEKHRKVFEVLGDKTKCPVADDQLSGLGFSSTRKDKVTVLATGPNLNKAYTIVFG